MTKSILIRTCILIVLGMTLWLGGYGVKGSLVPEEIGKGLSGLGIILLAITAVYCVKIFLGVDKHKQKNENL